MKLYFSGFQFDYVFDWTILKYQQSQITAPPARAIVSFGMPDIDFSLYANTQYPSLFLVNFKF